MSGGFFRGTSADQDTRFSNKTAKLLKTQKFAPELDQLIDMSKIKMDTMRPWIATRVTQFLGFEDEVLINFIYELLEGKNVDGKQIQIQLTGFMEKNTGKFMKELWGLLTSAQNTTSGIPQQFLDDKAEEARLKKAEEHRVISEVRRKEEEKRVFEQEMAKKEDVLMEDKNVANPKPRSSSSSRGEKSPDGDRVKTRNGTANPRPSRSRSQSGSPMSSKSALRFKHFGDKCMFASLYRCPLVLPANDVCREVYHAHRLVECVGPGLLQGVVGHRIMLNVGLGLLLGELGHPSLLVLQGGGVAHIPALLEDDLRLLLPVRPGGGVRHNCLILLVADLLLFAPQGDGVHLCSLGLLLAGGSPHLGLLLDIDEGLQGMLAHQFVDTLKFPHLFVTATLLTHPNVTLSCHLDDVLICRLLVVALLLHGVQLGHFLLILFLDLPHNVEILPNLLSVTHPHLLLVGQRNDYLLPAIILPLLLLLSRRYLLQKEGYQRARCPHYSNAGFLLISITLPDLHLQ